MIVRSFDAAYTNEPNDIQAIKSHYIKTLIDHLLEKNTDDLEQVTIGLCKK
jgi:hypothetical protein